MQHPLNLAVNALQLALVGGSLVVWAALVEQLVRRRPLATYEPRLPVPWNGGDVALLGIAALLLQILIVAAAVSSGEAPPEAPSAPVAPSASATVALVLSRLVWLVLAVAYLARRVGAYADDMGFDLRRLGSDLRLAGITFLAAVLPVYGTNYVLTQVLGFKSEHPLVRLAQDQPGVGVMLLTTFAALAVAPLAEEFLLRVVLQGWLEKKQIELRVRRGGSPEGPAGFGPIVVAGAVFAALHQWPDGVPLFVFSLFVGYAYQRTHRIVAPLAVHFCVNALAMIELWRLFLTGPA
jgi:membrane protease YdiL (CAAX protease family)